MTERYTLLRFSVGLNGASNLLTYNFTTTANAVLAQEIATVITGSNALASAAVGTDISIKS
jgi:hypothetical protein